MKRSIVALLLLVTTLAMATPADAVTTHYRIHNGTDKYVLIIPFMGPSIIAPTGLRSWCISPHADDARDVVTTGATIVGTRAEVSAGGCLHTPILLNWYLPGPKSIDASGTFHVFAVVGYAGGVYTFTGQ